MDKLLKKHNFSAYKYYHFGVHLGLSTGTLNSFDTKHRGDVPRCLLEVLEAWLRQCGEVQEKGGCTITSLVKALRQVEENAAANGIEDGKI